MALNDWSRDIVKSGSTQGMSHKAYVDSLFELADIWTMTTEEGEYVHFLATLFHRITRVK